MAGVNVTFKVGNRRGVMKNDVDAQSSFVEAMGEETNRKASANISVDVPRLQRVLDTRIRNSLGQAVMFAAMNMVGVKSNTTMDKNTRAAPTRVLFNMGSDRGLGGEGDLPLINPSAGLTQVFGSQGFELQWQALSRRTIMKKSAGGKATKGTTPREQATKFFVHTGSLQKEIKALAQNVVDRTGTVKIFYAKSATAKSLRVVNNQRRIRVGRLQLRFMPKVPIRTLKGFLTEDPATTDPSMAFEKSLGLSPDALMKLQGVEGYQRPLLQPVFSYWMLTRIPRLVGTAISNAIRSR
ncbi:hypothetical protein [Rhizobium sp. Leaf383]|uniref:hypothetical protein n=1 Tax=Rhizobium sp. Leaf383 TaxID=1736357 RepID=UPI0007158C53|nr:hypothetical protein [Rhizobium sp. Leaf383]KQS84257.1 hypothetical protein ASG58_21035 [Rhizobium sp. Leaf383]